MSDLPNADETRREFLQTGVAATAAVALGGTAAGAGARSRAKGSRRGRSARPA